MFAKLLMASTLEFVLFTMSFAINNILSEANNVFNLLNKKIVNIFRPLVHS